jgi:hypothetical protein
VNALAETTQNQKIQDAYDSLKEKLTQQKCRLTAENPPNTVSVIQGSIWGTNPKTAQKNITFTLQQNQTETGIKAVSKLTPNYIKLTLAGVIFSIALAIVCFWIGWDLTGYASNGVGYWGWLANTGGPFSHFDPEIAAVFIRVTWILSAFLVGTLVVEGVVVFKVKTKIYLYAAEVLKSLAN